MAVSDTPDAQLVERLASGDERALDSLVERWQAPLLSFTYRYVQDEQAARELTQETLVRVYRYAERFDTNKRFSTWLFKIASNLCRNHLRWRDRHPEEPLTQEEDSESRFVPSQLRDQRDPAGRTIEAEDAELVRAAVSALPHRLKVAVLLYYYEDLSYQEIAGVIGCSERGVETRLYRARRELVTALGEKRRGSSSESCFRTKHA